MQKGTEMYINGCSICGRNDGTLFTINGGDEKFCRYHIKLKTNETQINN